MFVLLIAVMKSQRSLSSFTHITEEAIAAHVIKDLGELGLMLQMFMVTGMMVHSTCIACVRLLALIQEKSPLAVYTHCAGHFLNLVIGNSCIFTG